MYQATYFIAMNITNSHISEQVGIDLKSELVHVSNKERSMLSLIQESNNDTNYELKIESAVVIVRDCIK